MHDSISYPFVRGDDFKVTMTLTDPQNANAPVVITNWIISSQVRYARNLIDDLTVTIDNGPGGTFTISMPKEATALWPAGPKDKPKILKCDIQFDRPAPEGRISSNTFEIAVTEDQTQ